MTKKIFHNLPLKFFSLAISIFLWLFITNKGQVEMVIDVPLEFKNIPPGMELLRQNIKTVSLNVRGHERTLKGLRPSDIRVIIDLSKGKKGEYLYYIDKDDVVTQAPIQILRIEPTSVKITIDETISRIVSIKPNILGSPARGYEIKSIEVIPPYIEIEGAKSEVSGILKLKTDPIDITGIDSDFKDKIGVHTGGKNIRVKTPEVIVKINIVRTKK